jgi:phosphoserine phosphatase RsbX
VLDIGIAARPCYGFKDNGDSHYVGRLGSVWVVAVMDGLGHGSPAAEASRMAVECLKEQTSRSIEHFYRLCHERLRGTRGVVAGTAVIDLEQDQIEFTGVGNIEAVVYAGGVPTSLISSNGVLGGGILPRIHPARGLFRRERC